MRFPLPKPLRSSRGSRRGALLSAALLLLISSCAGGAEENPESPAPSLREQMQAELPPFSEAAVGKTPLVSAYYEECYGEVPGATHQAGYIDEAGYKVALHLFSPRGEARGSIVAIHGYLAHTLQLSSLIREALRQRYRVLALELPGHALSGGERGGIDAFADYGEILAGALETAEERLPRPWHAVGHSTGASTILVHLAEEGDPFGKVVFLAPLVKSKYYGLSRFGRFLSKPFLSEVSTGYDDVLGVRQMPLSWFDAQVRWNKRNDEYRVFERPLMVLQGDDDRVVAWRRNRRYLETHFPNMEYHLLDGAGHVILKKRPEILREALDLIFGFLDG